MSGFTLKAVATLLTLGTAAAAAVYVAAHVHNPAAPLHPTLANGSATTLASRSGRLHLTPQVETANIQPVTSTYAS